MVVWSDGHTAFAGNVEAKGGAQSGDGGRMEVSGKGTLAFSGTANASAATGDDDDFPGKRPHDCFSVS